MRLLLSVIAIIAPSLALAQEAATIDGTGIRFETVLSGLDRPVALMTAPGGRDLFVVEKTGHILRFAEGAPKAETFLDLSAQVSGGNEQGLLGLAFHPGFAENGRLFVNYTDQQGDTQIVAYNVKDEVADPATAKTILSIDQPYSNHNGGWLGFGPDGYLYIGTGDGGAGGDPQGNGQNKDLLLGKMLRIDVDGGEPYAIPPSNPFAAGDGRPEVFLLGLRNPWRNSFDGDQLYIGDVGQGTIEEIDVVSTSDGGANLGWNTLEGNDCYPPGAMCVQGGFVMPVHTYSHDAGCSVTGGIVYRGKAFPELEGRYFFADYCAGAVESFRYENGAAGDFVATGDALGSVGSINAFGTDGEGELYVLTDQGDALKMIGAQ